MKGMESAHTSNIVIYKRSATAKSEASARAPTAQVGVIGAELLPTRCQQVEYRSHRIEDGIEVGRDG